MLSVAFKAHPETPHSHRTPGRPWTKSGRRASAQEEENRQDKKRDNRQRLDMQDQYLMGIGILTPFL
ncbi:hypothetical protein K3495_g1665 [Podosphaera aphanis]|nr:hypothetical protein K3495_g1665 [Podosphaera aphanis]